MNRKKVLDAVLAGLFVLTLVLGCATTGSKAPPPTLTITPAKTVLSPILIKKSPLQFSGTGFVPKEIVVIDLLLPPGVKVKGANADEREIGIATAYADEKGAFSTKMQPLATLNWFFQVDFTPKGPDFKSIKPLPPRAYTIRALGMDSDRVCTAILEFVKPPKKK